MSKATVVKLLPADMELHWDAIKWVLTEMDDANSESARVFLMQVLVGAVVCWKISEDGNFKGFIFTSITSQPPYDRKTVNVHTLYAYEHVRDETWMTVVQVLNDFAKANKCTHFTGYSVNPRVAELASAIGATAQTNFVMEVR